VINNRGCLEFYISLHVINELPRSQNMVFEWSAPKNKEALFLVVMAAVYRVLPVPSKKHYSCDRTQEIQDVMIIWRGLS
jgi:hypothetical protein